ncbi:MAG TPA: DUF3035 domain-containing protein [Alphaproteobacteria bacterium]|jgi:hypothetical protein
MKRTLVAVALAGMAGGLGGCGLFQDIRSVSQELGKRGDGDEISTGAPLTVPPEATLRPPSTSASSNEGAARRAQVILRTDAPAPAAPAGRGRTARETGPSAGERELMTRSGVTRATSDVVRRTVDIEQQRSTSGQKEFTDRVLKYDPKAPPPKGDDRNARDATGDKPVIKRPGEL